MNEILNMNINDMPNVKFECSCGRTHHFDVHALSIGQDAIKDICRMAEHMAPHGYDAKTLAKAVWAGTAAMVNNDGSQTNEAIFWKSFESIYGAGSRKDEPLFVDFYNTDFHACVK